jgi:hypothetical protein
MNNGAGIKELMKLTISQIRELEKAQQTIYNIVEAQRNSVKEAKEKFEIEEEWAEDFVNDLNNKEVK